MRVTVTVEGVDAQVGKLNYLARNVADYRQLGAWDGVQAEFYRIEKEQFSSEGAAGRSGRYAPLSSTYAERKTKKYGPQPILTASGQMRDSLTRATAKNAVVEKTAQELVLGTTDPKAAYHQRGTSKMPKREVISFSDEQKARLVRPIEMKIRQLLDNAKLRDIRGF